MKEIKQEVWRTIWMQTLSERKKDSDCTFSYTREIVLLIVAAIIVMLLIVGLIFLFSMWTSIPTPTTAFGVVPPQTGAF